MLKREPASIRVPGAWTLSKPIELEAARAQDRTLAAPSMEPGVVRPQAPDRSVRFRG